MGELGGWRDLGRLYMDRARRLDPWRATMHGIAHTHLMRVDEDRDAIDTMLKLSPSPEKTRCPLDPTPLIGLKFYNARKVVEYICDKVEHAGEWIKILRNCDRRRMRHMKMEGRDVYGLGWKGIDMTLLDAGCEIPVVDVHLARYMAREDPGFLKAMGLSRYDPDGVAKKIRTIQVSSNPAKYDELWKKARERAVSEGVPPGEWHVAVWLRERFTSEYPKLSEEARLELAKRYVEKLFS
ncbi:MAG: hypothetical protein QXT64_03760 [Desulfurococcaceae archaeon]